MYVEPATKLGHDIHQKKFTLERIKKTAVQFKQSNFMVLKICKKKNYGTYKTPGRIK